MIGTCWTAAPEGVTARIVEVEVDCREQVKPGIVFVGLPDGSVKESRDRVKTALRNSGYDFPGSRRVVVNLAPADLRKEGPSFDLAFAVGLLLATGQVDAPRVRDHLLAGELSLDGRIRPVRGVLCMADRAARGGRWTGILVPPENAAEASLARGLRVVPVATLRDAIMFLIGAEEAAPVPPGPAGGDRLSAEGLLRGARAGGRRPRGAAGRGRVA